MQINNLMDKWETNNRKVGELQTVKKKKALNKLQLAFQYWVDYLNNLY